MSGFVNATPCICKFLESEELLIVVPCFFFVKIESWAESEAVLFKGSHPFIRCFLKLLIFHLSRVVVDDRLTCESAVYWRCVCEHIRSLGPSGDDYADKVIPSGVVYSKYLRR